MGGSGWSRCVSGWWFVRLPACTVVVLDTACTAQPTSGVADAKSAPSLLPQLGVAAAITCAVGLLHSTVRALPIKSTGLLVRGGR